MKKDQIFQSIQDHNYEEFKVLIGKGFNKKLKNSNNETLLDMSLKSYSSINLETRDNTNNIFYYLMENGYKDLDIKNITMKVIREIIHDNKLSIFIFLIEQGLNLEMRNSEGNTPLFLAIFYRKLEFIKLLLVKGANIKHINKKGESVYDYNKIKNFDRAFDDYNLIESILKKYDTNTYNKCKYIYIYILFLFLFYFILFYFFLKYLLNLQILIYIYIYIYLQHYLIKIININIYFYKKLIIILYIINLLYILNAI